MVRFSSAFEAEKLRQKIDKIITSQNKIKQLSLPKVASPYDYKADNLVYLEKNKPYIIDPDNAVFLPRIFDLALTLLLFHNVLDSAPNRIFTVREWTLFKQGYAESIKLTNIEKSHG